MSSFLLTVQTTSVSVFNPLWILAAIAAGGVLVTGGIWVGKIQTKTSSFNTLMTEVRDSLGEILQRLDPKPVSRGSPLQLTDLGKEIAEQIGADEWAWQKAEELAPQVVDFAAEFEFHAFAEEYVRGNEFKPSDDFRRKMEASAYQNGISTDQVRDVLVVVLRDVLLAKTAIET